MYHGYQILTSDIQCKDFPHLKISSLILAALVLFVQKLPIFKIIFPQFWTLAL